MRTTIRLRAACLIAISLCGLTVFAAGDDTLAAAKELYGHAAYEDALRMLDRLKKVSPADEALEVDQYRAFCLFGMARTEEAERVFADLLSTDPRFRLDDRDASPRLVAAFREVRQRQLPRLIEQVYGSGRAAYDQKQADTAAQQFRLVLELADDADAPKDQQLIKDLRILATGFLNLVEATRTPAVSESTPPPQAPAPPVVRPFYTVADADVVPPVAINQEMPTWPSGLRVVDATGILDVLINEKGEVEAAALRVRLDPVFDALILERAKQWRYRPATLAARPVKYRKTIEIKVRPNGST